MSDSSNKVWNMSGRGVFFKQEAEWLVFSGKPYPRPTENQHKRLEPKDVLKWMACNSLVRFYKWKDAPTESYSCAKLQPFLCWEIMDKTSGVAEQAGRHRINFQGGKCYSYEFSYVFFSKDAQRRSGYDVSHLCGNPKCWNPNHLCYESSSDNRSKGRDVCTGYVWGIDTGQLMFACDHTPECKHLRAVKDVS